MRNFILGTDWWTDCDDAVALRVLTRYIKREEANLLGVVINGCTKYAVASLMGFLRADGIFGIPVGIDACATDFGGWARYQKRLAEDYCPKVTNANGEDGVRLYRRILAGSAEPVDIIEIGFLQVITALLESDGDDISEKSGLELVKEKVSRVWVMGGRWDRAGTKEHNFSRTEKAIVASSKFCELCPVPVTFLGWEVGNDVWSGAALDEDDHLHRVLLDHGSKNGRLSWDPMLVLLALIGDAEKAGYETVTGKASVDKNTGRNYFKKCTEGIHTFVKKKYNSEYYENQIDEIL